MMSRSSILDSMSTGDPRGLETISETQPLRVVLDMQNPIVHTCNGHQENLEYPSFPRRTNNVIYSDDIHGYNPHQDPTSGWYPRRDVHYGELSSRSQFPSTEILAHRRRGSYCGSETAGSESRRLVAIGNDIDNQLTKTPMQTPGVTIRPHSACRQIDYRRTNESGSTGRTPQNTVTTHGYIERSSYRYGSLRSQHSQARDSDSDTLFYQRRNTPNITDRYHEKNDSSTDRTLKQSRRIISDVDGYVAS